MAYSINFILHFTSAVAAIGLVYWISKLHKELARWHLFCEVLYSKKSTKQFLNGPVEEILRDISHFFHIDFMKSGYNKSWGVVDLRLVLKAFVAANVRKIKVDSTKQPVEVRLTFTSNAIDEEAMADAFKMLGKKKKIKFIGERSL